MTSNQILQTPLAFADVFAGCGGLSLGLLAAGWKGSFAVEKNSDAFSTFAENLLDQEELGFSWPAWLPKAALSTQQLLAKHRDDLRGLRGKIALLAGGPPCQGFSLAGRRTQADPRNALTDDYIEIVALLEPRFVLLENVKGFTLPFKNNPKNSADDHPYSQKIEQRLRDAGYVVFSRMMDLSRFGVPQSRHRFILLGIKQGDTSLKTLGKRDPLATLMSRRRSFLLSKGLPVRTPIGSRAAIGDLETVGRKLIPCSDSPYKSYVQVDYVSSQYRTPFIDLMRGKRASVPDSLRLPKHKAETQMQFAQIMNTCERGKTLSSQDRLRLSIKKQALTPLHRTRPAATVTTLPDDMIHYSEPRILTARENARLQTFPDSFRFKGQYTTGGKNRRTSCPRYTQIGNAVPPLFAEAVGQLLRSLALGPPQ